MNRQLTFASPYLLGFEHLERLLERAARAAGDTYPPYNIEQTAEAAANRPGGTGSACDHQEGGIRITLAVAGFSADELSVSEEDRQLVIRGRQAEATGKTFPALGSRHT